MAECLYEVCGVIAAKETAMNLELQPPNPKIQPGCPREHAGACRQARSSEGEEGRVNTEGGSGYIIIPAQA